MYVSFFFLCQQTKRHKFRSISGKRLIVLNCSEVFPVTSLLGSSGPFLESSETFRTYFGLHNSLCIFKMKASRARNFAFILIFIPFTTYEKTSFTKLAGRSFTNGFSGPESFRDFRLRNGPQAVSRKTRKLIGPEKQFLKL